VDFSFADPAEVGAGARLWDNAEMEKRDELQELRAEIDIMDRNIITSLAERMELVEEIGRYKRAHNMEALDEDRRDDLLKTWIETGRALLLPEELLRDTFEAIHRYSLFVEEKSRNI
jgi:chorismate mutase